MSRVVNRARNHSRMWLTGGLLLGILALGACSSTPAVEDLDLTQIETDEAVAAREALEMNACMAEAGYSDFRSPPMLVSSSSGVIIPLAEAVDIIMREVNSPAAPTYLTTYIDEHALTDGALTAFSESFLLCDDARAEKRINDSDSARGAAQAVMGGALRELHESPEYLAAMQEYVACMRADGWDVQDNGSLLGEITEVLQESVVEPGNGEGASGLVGAVLDPGGVERARGVQAELVESDIACGADTLEPVYLPFNEKYGALAAALYGVRPDGVNRVRL